MDPDVPDNKDADVDDVDNFDTDGIDVVTFGGKWDGAFNKWAGGAVRAIECCACCWSCNCVDSGGGGG